jgi:competence protein ComGD
MKTKLANSGFTLIESIIVISLISLLMITSLFARPPSNSKSVYENFLAEYQSFWNKAESLAVLNDQEVLYTIHQDRITIDSGRMQEELKFPQQITAETNQITIKSDGYVQPRTLQFYFEDQDFKIIYSMAGGVYRVED